MREALRILPLLAAILWLNSACAAEAEVRGTWLTTTGNDALATPFNTEQTMRKLRDIGLNTVYVECWKNGYTDFPSDVMKNAIGVEMKVNPSAADKPAEQRDLLAECVTQAHRNGMLCIAWFEYGFMAAHQDTHNELRDKHHDWLVLDANGGDVAKNGFVWLNPLRTECQDLLIGIVVEAVQKYDLDGVQLDDRIVWPSLEMGYDEFTKKAYAAEHDGREPPADFNDPEWREWRQKKVEAFSHRFVTEVRKANPNLIISLSPAPHPWALDNKLIDWPSWSRWPAEQGRWDEFVPQVYRLNFDAFKATWDQQVTFVREGNRLKDLLAGIRLVGEGPDQPAGDATKAVQLVRTSGAGGHVWWFSRGVTGPFEKELRALYDVPKNGQAPHPAKGADWRPPSIAATLEGQWWKASVPAGTWSVIAKIDGHWREVLKLQGKGGQSQPVLPVGGEYKTAEAVELLVDRRPPAPAPATTQPSK